MAPSPKVTLEQIVAVVRALWSETGAAPLTNTVRTRLGNVGAPDRLELGISLVGTEYGINCSFLDRQPAEIRALVIDPRGPNGLLPLDPLTRERVPEGVLAGALAMLRGSAEARRADEAELERRVALERHRADAVAESCERRVTAALAAQLSAEQRYANQEADHLRDTLALREQLAAAVERLRVLEQESSPTFVALADAVVATGEVVQGMSHRLTQVERLVRPVATTPRSQTGKTPATTRPTKSAPRSGGRETPGHARPPKSAPRRGTPSARGGTKPTRRPARG